MENICNMYKFLFPCLIAVILQSNPEDFPFVGEASLKSEDFFNTVVILLKVIYLSSDLSLEIV